MNTLLIILLCIGLGLLVYGFQQVSQKANNPSFSNKSYLNTSVEDERYNDILNLIKNKLQSYTLLTNKEESSIKELLKTMSKGTDYDIISNGFFTLALRKIKSPIGQIDIMLNRNEELIYSTNSISLFRYATDTRTIMGSGFRKSEHGFKLFGGTYKAINNEELKMIEGLGKLYVTNQRIIYITDQNKTYTIPMSRIIDFAIEDNSVIITVSNGKPYKFMTNNNFFYYEDSAVVDSTYHIAKSLQEVKGVS